MKKKTHIFIYCLIFFSLEFYSVLAEQSKWITSAGNYKAHKYSELKQINDKSILNLQKAWSYKSNFISDEKINNQLTPIFTGRSIIFASLEGYLISINPLNGVENWRTKLKNPVAKRGLLYLDNHKIILVTTSNGVFAVDEVDGKINTNFGDNGKFGNSLSLLPPIVDEEDIFVAFNNKIESFILKNEKKNWSINLNGARVWSGFSFDKETNTIAVVTSNLITLWGNTNINPDYSNSLLLIDSINGKIKCSFKDVLHDHWDLDMQGNPIFLDIKIDNHLTKVVYAFSKTGNVFLINVNKCDFAFKESENFTSIKTNVSNFKNQTYSKKQTKINLPEPLMDQKYNFNSYIQKLNNKDKIAYLEFKTRNSKFNEDFIPLSMDYDVIMYGLHGGPSWSGGSLDKINNQIIIPSNHYPWIIRSFYYDRLLNKLIMLNYKLHKKINEIDYLAPWLEKKNIKNEESIKKVYSYLGRFVDKTGYNLYKIKCQSCHGVVREGKWEDESKGDLYIPPLVGISLTNKFDSLKEIKKFNYSHSFEKNLKSVTQEELTSIKDYFSEYDKILKKLNLLGASGIWQLFLDNDKLPASTPPWGKLNAIDVNTGKINWSIPLGIRNFNSKIFNGDLNFGGVLSTAGNITIVTGTPDKFVRAFNSKSGQQIWEHKLPASGSSSPMTYEYKGEQYLLINAGGGRFFGYEDELTDQLISFKIY